MFFLNCHGYRFNLSTDSSHLTQPIVKKEPTELGKP